MDEDENLIDVMARESYGVGNESESYGVGNESKSENVMMTRNVMKKRKENVMNESKKENARMKEKNWIENVKESEKKRKRKENQN